MAQDAWLWWLAEQGDYMTLLHVEHRWPEWRRRQRRRRAALNRPEKASQTALLDCSRTGRVKRASGASAAPRFELQGPRF